MKKAPRSRSQTNQPVSSRLRPFRQSCAAAGGSRNRQRPHRRGATDLVQDFDWAADWKTLLHHPNLEIPFSESRRDRNHRQVYKCLCL